MYISSTQAAEGYTADAKHTDVASLTLPPNKKVPGRSLVVTEGIPQRGKGFYTEVTGYRTYNSKCRYIHLKSWLVDVNCNVFKLYLSGGAFIVVMLKYVRYDSCTMRLS